MADSEPKWIPVAAGAGVITVWTAAIVGIGWAVVQLAGADVDATILIAFGVWWLGFAPVVKLVHADLTGGRDD